MKVLITCPPMLGLMDEFVAPLRAAGIEPVCPPVVQTLGEAELRELLPGVDGWIAGDDPATRDVLGAGRAGRLRAIVKWGVGVDNVDLAAARELGLPVHNTPGLFGREVGDLAMAYLVALARETHAIDAAVQRGEWPKPRGISLAGRVLGLAGFGDIGRNVARRALTAEMRVVAWDPAFTPAAGLEAVTPARWPERLDACDFLVLACALTPANRHMLGAAALRAVKRGVRIVNVARGGLIDEDALAAALASGQVHSAALDVFETEPLPQSSPLRRSARCVFGSHNGSNTVDAVRRASERAVALMVEALATA